MGHSIDLDDVVIALAIIVLIVAVGFLYPRLHLFTYMLDQSNHTIPDTTVQVGNFTIFLDNSLNITCKSTPPWNRTCVGYTNERNDLHILSANRTLWGLRSTCMHEKCHNLLDIYSYQNGDGLEELLREEEACRIMEANQSYDPVCDYMIEMILDGRIPSEMGE